MSRDVQIPVMLRTRKFIFARFMKGLKKRGKITWFVEIFLEHPIKVPQLDGVHRHAHLPHVHVCGGEKRRIVSTNERRAQGSYRSNL